MKCLNSSISYIPSIIWVHSQDLKTFHKVYVKSLMGIVTYFLKRPAYIAILKPVIKVDKVKLPYSNLSATLNFVIFPKFTKSVIKLLFY